MELASDLYLKIPISLGSLIDKHVRIEYKIKNPDIDPPRYGWVRAIHYGMALIESKSSITLIWVNLRYVIQIMECDPL